MSRTLTTIIARLTASVFGMQLEDISADNKTWPCRGFAVMWAAVVNQTLCNAIVCMFEWWSRIAYLKQHQIRVQGLHDLNPWVPPVSPLVYSAVVPTLIVMCWPWLSQWT